jgi:hypothetical protein
MRQAGAPESVSLPDPATQSIDDRRPAKGIVIGILLAIPFWAIAIWLM